MAQALFIVGLLIGVVLSGTVALFGILSMDGRFTENLRAAMSEAHRWITGRHRRTATTAVAARSPETDNRVRGLQEEVKVMQRLLEQGRGERESHAADRARAGEEIAALKAAVAERDERILALESELREEGTARIRLRDELAERAADLARAQREARDLETELSVVQSGAGLSCISEEIAALRRERDELVSRLAREAGGARPGKENLALVR